MNNINKQIIATQMPDLRPQNIRPGLISGQIPIQIQSPFQAVSTAKPTIGNFVTTTNTAGTSFFLLPSNQGIHNVVSNQSIVTSVPGSVSNVTAGTQAPKGITQFINPNQIVQNKGKIMLLATAPAGIKTATPMGQTIGYAQKTTLAGHPTPPKIITGLAPSTTGQTMTFAQNSIQKTTLSGHATQQKIITGLTPSSTGQTIQFITAIPGSNYTQSTKLPIHVANASSNCNNNSVIIGQQNNNIGQNNNQQNSVNSVNNSKATTTTTTQIVTVIDNQNGQLQIRPALNVPKQEIVPGTTRIIHNNTINTISTPKAKESSPAMAVQQIVVEESVDIDPEEARRLLEANEELESSTDISAELVPGISSFTDKKDFGMSYFDEKELEEYNSLQKSKGKDPRHDSQSNIRKLTCSFGFSEYGVTSVTKPVFSKGLKRSVGEENEDSNHNSNFNSRKSDANSNSVSKNSLSSSQSSSSVQSAKSEKVPRWQKDLSPEEITAMNAFASLTSNVLHKKLKDIHNTAFHLAFEEEKEMLKARFLNILDSHTETNINGHSCNLAGNDFAASESKLCLSSDSCSR